MTIATLLCSLPMSAHDCEVDGIYYNLDNTNLTATVTYKGSRPTISFREEAVILPKRFSYSGATYSVTSIGDSAFYNYTGLTSITIPNSVMSIGNNAFENCRKLSTITIPNSVTCIGNFAFSRCSGLTSITIPNSVTSIGDNAFYRCSDLTSITIPESVTSMGSYAFHETAWYKNLQSGVIYINKVLYSYKHPMSSNTIEIKEGTVCIAGHALNECSSLTSISIPNSVTSIGNNAFAGCIKLSSITIPNSVTNIGSSAFGGCSSLTSFTIPNSITSIGEYAFQECTGLTSITIPESITSIGRGAFRGCTGLSSISIPETVTNIGRSAFANCTDLISISIGNTVTNMGEYAFNNTAWYNNQPDGVVYINNVFYTYKGTMPANTSIEIKEGTISIAGYAFFRCTDLTSITIPNSVTSIGCGAFQGCTSLTSFTIPNSVTSIGAYALNECSGLTTITIPNSVTSIGHNAFSECYGLISITIGSGVLSINNIGLSINNYAWPKVIWLASTPPSGYTTLKGEINYVPNSKYKELENTLEIPYLNELVEENGIKYVPLNLEERTCGVIDLGQGATEKEVYIKDKAMFRGIEMKVNEVLPYAFSGYWVLKEVTLPTSIEKVGTYAFKGCYYITKLTCYATTPPACDTKALESIDKKNCELIVPTGCTAAYQAAEQWKDFFFMSETGIEDVRIDATSTPASVDVYNLYGERVKTGVASDKAGEGLSRGIYILNGKKFLVK